MNFVQEFEMPSVSFPDLDEKQPKIGPENFPNQQVSFPKFSDMFPKNIFDSFPITQFKENIIYDSKRDERDTLKPFIEENKTATTITTTTPESDTSDNDSDNYTTMMTKTEPVYTNSLLTNENSTLIKIEERDIDSYEYPIINASVVDTDLPALQSIRVDFDSTDRMDEDTNNNLNEYNLIGPSASDDEYDTEYENDFVPIFPNVKILLNKNNDIDTVKISEELSRNDGDKFKRNTLNQQSRGEETKVPVIQVRYSDDYAIIDESVPALKNDYFASNDDYFSSNNGNEQQQQQQHTESDSSANDDDYQAEQQGIYTFPGFGTPFEHYNGQMYKYTLGEPVVEKKPPGLFRPMIDFFQKVIIISFLIARD